MSSGSDMLIWISCDRLKLCLQYAYISIVKFYQGTIQKLRSSKSPLFDQLPLFTNKWFSDEEI